MRRTMCATVLLALLALCLAGCGMRDAPGREADDVAAQRATADVAAYIDQTRALSQSIRASMENDPLTQMELNQKSQALRDLWEGAMASLLAEAQRILTETEMAQLAAEQAAWEAEMQVAIDAAGLPYEGGSLYALIVNTEAARLTEARVEALYERLK